MRALDYVQKLSPRIKHTAVSMLFLLAYTTSAVTPFIALQHADAAPLCSIDTSGANESGSPGQKDLTRMCVDPVTGQISWNWDEISVNGSNTLDGCALFDTDGDGYANKALCISSSDGVTYTKTTYTCNDTSTDRCAGADAGTPATSTCTLAVTATQPFPTGANTPNDLTATCTPTATDTGNGTMIDVCSYPSAQPNSDPSDCVMYRDRSARIEVRKVVDPATDGGLFNLKIGTTTYATNIGNGGTTGEQILTSGSITVSETPGTNTSLASYTTTVVCKDGNGTGNIVGQSTPTGTTSRQFTFTAADASDIVCVFTNTRQTGTVTLVKTVVNDNGGTLGANDFGLTVGGVTVTNGQVVTLPAGVAVAVNEAGANGYSFVSITGNGCPTTLGGTVTPINNQNITCTITNNDQPGKLIIKKIVVNDNSGLKQAPDFKFQVNGGAETTFEGDGQNELTVNAGTYNVTEVADSQYAATYNNCSNLNIGIGATATCTITNDDKPATLKLTKTVINDNAGTLSAIDFPVFLNGQTSSWGTYSLDAGTYTVNETTKPGYTPSAWGGDCVTKDGTVNVTLLPGDTKECTITNNDQPAQLSGVKYEVDADGKAVIKTLSGWTICLDANGNGKCDSGETTTTTGSDGSYSFTGLNVGTYSLAESNSLGGGIDGWTQIFAPQTVTLGLGGNSKDNNFGNFKNGSVSGYKFNDLNGEKGVEAGEPGLPGWDITLSGTTTAVNGKPSVSVGPLTAQTNASGYYEFTNLAPGTYTVCEVPQANWVQTYPGPDVCHTVVIDKSGENNPDTNFGNRAKGTIEIVKDLYPSKDPGVFDLSVDGTVKASNVTDGGSTGAVTVWAGDDHTVSEAAGTATSLSNYTSSYDCTNGQSGSGTSVTGITIAAGDHIICTFTNTRDTGTITVIKEVTNNNGGMAEAGDFSLYVNTKQVTSGDNNAFNTNVSYNVSEDNVDGYEQQSLTCTLPGGVPLGRPFTLQKGQHVTCTIVNNDIAPKLTVIKHVNNNGTSNDAVAANFEMLVTGTNVSDSSFNGAESPGTTVTLNAGTYAVSEGEHDGYTMSTGDGCTGTIAVGQEKTCTITNTAIQYPDIEVIKRGPDVAHEGDEVRYTYDVTNTGNVPFYDGSITDLFVGDDAEYSPEYVSGDSNDNGQLDPGETWQFELGYTIPVGQTADVENTVTACGYIYGEDWRSEVDYEQLPSSVCDEDDHTLDVLHPNLQVAKSGPANVRNGGTATYTFTVTNTGDTPLDITSVFDDVAGLGVYQSGDSNGDGMLDLNETWTYQASKVMNTDGSVKNTVTVCASDELEGKVCNTGSHTTIVFTPKVLAATLENTGQHPLVVVATSLGLIGFAIETFLTDRRRRIEWHKL